MREVPYAYILYAVNLQSSSPIYTMSACEFYLKKILIGKRGG